MKNILLILLISLLFTKCKNTNEIESDSTKIKDINEIVRTIVLEDSLNVLKKDKESIMLCENLIRLNIIVIDKNKDKNTIVLPRSYFNQISIDELLNKKIENNLFFNPSDSLFLLNQNINTEKIKINEKNIEKINLTSIEKEIGKRKANQKYSFYQMTIPVFSKDKQKAYLELNHYCGRLCASGKSIYLKKINGKWKIIYKIETWVS